MLLLLTASVDWLNKSNINPGQQDVVALYGNTSADATA